MYGPRLPGGRPGLIWLGVQAELADVLDRIDLSPDLAAQPPEAFGRAGGSAAQDKRVVAHLDGQPVASLDSQAPARLTGQ
jgi:hypothetical protein